MGCSSSKLDEEAAVKTCHDRKSFVKKAIAQRGLLASSHVAYVQSLRRVSMALFYYFAEDEHLYFLQEQSSCLHHPSSPEKVLVINFLRPARAPVHPVVEQWDPEAVETATIDKFFGLDHQFIHPSSIDSMNDTPISPQPPRWDLPWDPFSSLNDHPLYADYGVEGIKVGQAEDEQIPELEEESDDDDGDDHPEGETEEEEEEEEKGEQANAAPPEVAPRKEEERKVGHVNNELRVMASADVEQRGTPGFTVYVDRPPTSMAEAMKDIQGHFLKIVDTASEVSVLLEVVPYHRRVQPPAPRDDGDEQGAPEIPPEPFELFQSHKESLDRLYEWEKRLYEEVRAGERVRLAYEKKCALLRSQDANGAEPFAIEKTRVAIRDLRTKLDISLTSVDAVSKRITAVRDDELLPQLMQLVRGLARMWRVIADAHRVMKRTVDEATALLTSSAAAAAAARPALVGEGGIRGPPPPPSSTRAAAGAGALGAELRGWRAALEAWAESQRSYAAALWGWARSCVKDGEDMPRLIVGWARAVESVDVDAATRAVDAVAAEAAAIASAAKRQRGSEEWFNEEEAKKKVCLGLTAALAAIAEAGGLAVLAYDELLLEMEMEARGEQDRELAGRDDESIQN
ncbi:hypothetical protein C2845_PM12G04350 [Panicum miliaceum]|uniref:DUF632 domain-containing protein n=1 Tax=Panicum miliaceum TaxID=4540 RepID=A0A3L6QGB0_PANMI|nr:hypothetical protein C2845_PM12G04350 [Panicum miliaceum]